MRFLRVITLKPKTAKGKRIIKECGLWWVVIKEADKVIFSSEAGPWWLIESQKAGIDKQRTSRWVHSKRDKDFEINRNIEINNDGE